MPPREGRRSSSRTPAFFLARQGLPAALFAAPALAADAFFKGKTVTVITSTGAGGTYDTVARAVSRHMPRHLAGKPTMIVQNMPGGGHMRATNYMYNVAPKDGTRLATIHNAVPLHQVIDGRGVRFDVAKFNWLGSTGADNSGIIVWHTAKVKTYGDLLKKEAILGGTGPGSGIVLFPTVMNSVLGTKFKIVLGYKSSEEINVAMERGEVEARAFGLTSIFATRSHWVTGKKIRFLAQVGAKRDPRIAKVPLLTKAPPPYGGRRQGHVMLRRKAMWCKRKSGAGEVQDLRACVASLVAGDVAIVEGRLGTAWR